MKHTVTQAQLGDGLAAANDFLTIQTDGTTKYGEHFTTYDVKVESVTYCLGQRHVFSGSSHDTLETFKEILSDIDSVHLSLGQEAVSSKIVSKIKNTMSDRHAAEKLFNEMLHDYRAENLPDVIGNWEELSADEKVNMTRIILIHASSSQSYSCCSLIFAVSSLSALSLVLILSLRNIIQYKLQIHHPPPLRWPMISCSVIFLS